jgi:hypothetical protein
MLQDDYLLRLIRRAGEMLAKALGLIDQRKLDEAEAEIREALRQLAKLPLDTLVTLDLPTLRSVLGGGDAQAARLAARAFASLGAVAAARGEEIEARRQRVVAMKLYREVGVGDDPVDVEAARALAASFPRKPV